MSDLKTQIARELCRALRSLGADKELLSTVGSYGDTLDDDAVRGIAQDLERAGRASNSHAAVN